MLTMDRFGLSKSLPDEVEMPSRGGYALRRLFLESMQHVHNILESHNVHHAIGIPLKTVADFEHTRTKTFQGFGTAGVVTQLPLRTALARFRS
jgi:hypothetical protein